MALILHSDTDAVVRYLKNTVTVGAGNDDINTTLVRSVFYSVSYQAVDDFPEWFGRNRNRGSVLDPNVEVDPAVRKGGL